MCLAMCCLLVDWASILFLAYPECSISLGVLVPSHFVSYIIFQELCGSTLSLIAYVLPAHTYLLPDTVECDLQAILLVK